MGWLVNPIGQAAVSTPATTGPRCTDRSPKTNRPCTRAADHTGRHHYAWTHLDQRVREVWADCQICGGLADGAVCAKCGDR